MILFIIWTHLIIILKKNTKACARIESGKSDNVMEGINIPSSVLFLKKSHCNGIKLKLN